MKHESTFETFILKLQKLYGAFDFDKNKFVEASNSSIARELGYSDAQFSRLINKHATAGEYHRVNQNAERILALMSYEEKFAKINVNPSSALASPRKRMMFFTLGIVLGGLFIYLLILLNRPETAEYSKYDMLTWTFESNFINPYKGLRELPTDCDYECYKYQGKWELKEEYKLPFLRERSGFHYLAKSVVSYIRCLPEENPNGKKMKGYEYQKHEIWYDILERSIGEFVADDGNQLDTYKELEFNKAKEFILIGTIHSLYTNDFLLDANGISRHGQDIGRDLEFVPEDELASQLQNKTLLEKIKREVTFIIQDPLRDFSQPSNCEIAKKPDADFHSISNGAEIVFNCEMTTAGRFRIGYSKNYVLQDQYIRDMCVEATE
ncbi:MAG: hypothetical protein ACI8QD_002299 [Cyclobacteriaceae bacterium]|jgi:hypothetical protein